MSETPMTSEQRAATGAPAASHGRQPRTMLDLARTALSARMAKDDLRLVLENVVTYAASLEARVTELEERIERRRMRLVAAEADLLAVRGLLSPAGGPRQIPAEVEIHERVAPAVEWLLNRVAELETERHTTNAALSEAAEALREQRDRIADLEQLLAAKDRPVDEDPIRYALTPKAEASAAGEIR
ncbi:hypothetical protein [Streptomyces sp. NPDC013455]|uniref:hypothetical protein n=1 Tax=Streptomyces sp. NPDC013455 TaxID=3155605 RepID=UPI00341011E4